jgi:hypothetical protein
VQPQTRQHHTGLPEQHPSSSDMFAQDRDHGLNLVLRYSSGLADLGLGTREVSERFIHFLKKIQKQCLQDLRTVFVSTAHHHTSQAAKAQVCFAITKAGKMASSFVKSTVVLRLRRRKRLRPAVLSLRRRTPLQAAADSGA